jgi:KRAB domain-containing zinc finger protein
MSNTFPQTYRHTVARVGYIVSNPTIRLMMESTIPRDIFVQGIFFCGIRWDTVHVKMADAVLQTISDFLSFQSVKLNSTGNEAIDFAKDNGGEELLGEQSSEFSESAREEVFDSCEICKKVILPSDTKDSAARCEMCVASFTHKRSAVQRYRGSEKRFSCDVCKKRFAFRSRLDRHTRVHTGARPFACDLCKKQFAQSSSLKTHLREHTGERPFSCKICEKKFNYKSTLKTHIRLHSGERPYSCKICNKKFFLSSNLKTHLTVHSKEKNFSCEVCKKRFSQRSNLCTHLKVHTGEQPFSCEACKRRFSHRSNLKKHLRVHTGERPFSCEVCKKRFAQRIDLHRHLGIHSAERPFSCKLCKKRFTNPSNLKRHLAVHSGEKNFSCEVCKKLFSQRHNLIIHLRTHTREKPFTCKVCKKKYTRSSNLKAHLRLHTGERLFSRDVWWKRVHLRNIRRQPRTQFEEGRVSLEDSENVQSSALLKGPLTWYSEVRHFSCEKVTNGFPHIFSTNFKLLSHLLSFFFCIIDKFNFSLHFAFCMHLWSMFTLVWAITNVPYIFGQIDQ